MNPRLDTGLRRYDSMMFGFYRGFRAVLHILIGIFLAIGILLTGGVKRWKVEGVMSWWSGVMLDIFNIQVRVVGTGIRGPRLLVANHVSWLDIILIGCVEPTRFVAKSEIQHWPIAGWLANAMGTFYIRRGKGGAKPLLEKVVPHLQAGGSFILYPEGTTTDGASVLPFHARLFQAAIEAQCPVQPLALRFSHGADGSNVAPFIGDDDLASHMLRLLKEPALIAEVTYCAPISLLGRDRDSLALAAHAAIAGVVAEPLEWRPFEAALDDTDSAIETRPA
ncbi:MAG: 1-acyl-sn-glycerol-3-phosphate acyltransferase [Pseudomonadota bacterium]|mgnify:CR=1 FL=1